MKKTHGRRCPHRAPAVHGVVYMVISAVLSAALLCSCSLFDSFGAPDTAASDETVKPYVEVVPDELSYSEGYEPVVSSYAYDALPLQGEKALYERLLEECYDISPEINEESGRYAMPRIIINGYSLTEAQVRTAAKALTDDHPEIFWTTGTIGYYTDGSSTVVQVYSQFSPDEIDTRVNALRAAANEFYATVPDGLSEFDRELTVHDYLIDRVVYDESVDSEDLDSNDPDIYTVYGALVDGVAVCEGYARAFQMLMNGLGVDCVGIIGQSHDQMHMWNAVKLDESWFYTDPTWDDQEESFARYIYYNVDEDFLTEDHTLSPMYYELSDDEINDVIGDFNASVMNIFVPECSRSDMGYYYLKSPHLSDYDGEDVKSGLLSSALAQEEYFVFYIDEELDYQTAISLLFAEYPQYFFSYVRAVNNTLTDYSIDSSNVSYVALEKSRIAAAALRYY